MTPDHSALIERLEGKLPSKVENGQTVIDEVEVWKIMDLAALVLRDLTEWRDRDRVHAALTGVMCGYDGRLLTGDFWPGMDAVVDAVMTLPSAPNQAKALK